MNKNTRFSSRIRIDPKQLEWLAAHKGTYKTLAGTLDMIINHYKIMQKIKIKFVSKETGKALEIDDLPLDTWKFMEAAKKKSGKSWNDFIKQLLDNKKTQDEQNNKV